MKSIPAGGPSTVNGVLYQLLFSLLTVGGFRPVGPKLTSGVLDRVTLILEPSTGGDQQSFHLGKRVVTQLKARSTGGSWSLQEIIRGVLPDLYRAVDPTQLDTEYHFVTEGNRGKWLDVEDFFLRLPSAIPSGSCLDELDDTTEIKFGRSQTKTGSQDHFWGNERYTERRLFKKIVDSLRERGEVKSELYEETCRKTWALLQGFRFVGGFTHEALSVELDRWLLVRIGVSSRLSEKRDHLLLELGRRACSGDTAIQAKEFLESHGLADTPLTEWAILSEKAHAYLTGVLRRKRIELCEDVRPGLTDDILHSWTKKAPIIVLSGESGSGKTWHAYQALLSAAANGDVAILVDSRGNADHDLVEAEKNFWNRIVGVDDATPLDRLQARLKQIDPANELRQVTLLIDNVSSPAEAQRLLDYDWETAGIRLAITCNTTIAEIIRRRLGGRGRNVVVGDYTIPELQAFISRVVGITWEDVPFDVQKTIRRPLLAKMFSELVDKIGWQPRNEYDLFEAAWNSLIERGVKAIDFDGLRTAALRVFTNEIAYPWSTGDLRECGLDVEGVERLVGAGWFRETTAKDFEIWHDRLLNWTVAEALSYQLQRFPVNVEQHLQAIAALFNQPQIDCGRTLGYVPLDLMWLLSADSSKELFPRVVTACEISLGRESSEILHKQLLPTLGSRAVPLLLSRLLSAAQTEPLYQTDHLIDGLVATRDEGLRERATEFLDSPCAKIRRAGVRLITKLPIPDVLTRLWAIHVEGVQNPAPYLGKDSSQWTLYQDTFDALAACVPLDLPWLERTIHAANPVAVPVHDLAYLVSIVGDDGTWRRCKKVLFANVDSTKERAIASCILRFRDRDELVWLQSRVLKTEDLVGMVALRALTIIEPVCALTYLDQIDEQMLYLTRKTCFSELYLHLPGEVMARFAINLRSHDRPLRYALVLQGQENLIDVASFDFLLERVTDALATTIVSTHPSDIEPDCRIGLAFMRDVSRPDLLDRLRLRRSTALEQNLVKLAISFGPQMGQWMARDKFDLLAILARIGGDGFNSVLDIWLEQAGWGGQIHAVKLAQRRTSVRTNKILKELSETGGTGNDQDREVLSGYAAAALATHGCWEPVLRYYLSVGFRSLSVVESCCPEIVPQLDDSLLADVLTELRGEAGQTPGAVMCVGIAGRRDLLPEVRAALIQAAPESDLAGASLLALCWLHDTNQDIVPVIAKHLESHKHKPHAIDALLANGSLTADVELKRELKRSTNLQHAIIIANNPRLRTEGIEAIRLLACNNPRSRFELDFRNFVYLADPEVLDIIAGLAEFYAIAEEAAYSPYERVRMTGEKPAALRIVGMKQPDAAVQMAIAWMRHPDTPDRELFVPIVSSFAGASAVTKLLNLLRLDPSWRVIHSIGCELSRLDAEESVLQWFQSPTVEERQAACRVAGFLPFTTKVYESVRKLAVDRDKRVSDAAVDAHERLTRGKIAHELVRALATEVEKPHCWVLVDALISVADPGVEGTVPPWCRIVKPYLTPALNLYMLQKLKERQKKFKEELDREDHR